MDGQSVGATMLSSGGSGQRRHRSGSFSRNSMSGMSVGGSKAPPPPPNLSAAVNSGLSHMPLSPVFERFHTFKEFMALQKDSLEPERAVELYDQYKFDFKTHSARLIFLQNQVEFPMERSFG